MLLYRPLLSAYQRSSVAAARRFLLREFASPQLHVEPDEMLQELTPPGDASLEGNPELMWAITSLQERSTWLHLTTRDPIRQLGGRWTARAVGKDLVNWARSDLSLPQLTKIASKWLSPIVFPLLSTASGDSRATLLAALGDLGEDAGLEPLLAELSTGSSPAAAAIGLARMGPDGGAPGLLKAVEARGLDACVPWVGIALAGTAGPEVRGLVDRLVRSTNPLAREEAAWALGSFQDEDVSNWVETLIDDPDWFVRLNLATSLAHLGVPGGVKTLSRLVVPKAPPMLRTAAIHAAGSTDDASVIEFLKDCFKTGSPEDQAAVVEAFVSHQGNDNSLRDLARVAADSPHERCKLVGLLALACCEPEEAFSRIRTILETAGTNHWYIATYVLRYLKTDQTVPTLLALYLRVRGTDLEELTVSALCRHLAKHQTVSALMKILKAGSRPLIVRRIALDLAHHLPDEEAASVVKSLRTILAESAPAVTGPLLITLGALGASEDIDILTQKAQGETLSDALHGMELLGERKGIECIESIARTAPPPIRERAIVVLFRLGSPAALEELARLAGSPDTVRSAARVVREMALSVRLLKVASRLSRLHAALASDERKTPAPVLQVEAAPDPTPMPRPRSRPTMPAANPDQIDPLASSPAISTRRRSMYRELIHAGTERKTARVPILPKIHQSGPVQTGQQVYNKLGDHYTAEGESSEPGRVLKILVYAFVGMCLVAATWALWLRRPQTWEGQSEYHAHWPPISVSDKDPEESAVATPTVLQSKDDSPVRLRTRYDAEGLTLNGKLRLVKATYSDSVPPTLMLEGVLLEGNLRISLQHGETTIQAGGAGHMIHIRDGEALLESREELFHVTSFRPEVWVSRTGVTLRTIKPGQVGHFSEGDPVGKIEDAPH